jgi:hypothetical protein
MAILILMAARAQPEATVGKPRCGMVNARQDLPNVATRRSGKSIIL